jgi:hypothetical protein
MCRLINDPNSIWRIHLFMDTIYWLIMHHLR